MWNYLTLALGAMYLAQVAVAVPPGFVDEGAGRVFDITAFNFAPKPLERGTFLMATAKAGLLYALPDLDDNPSNQVLMLNIEDKVCNNGERGLNTVLAHPNFVNNRWIYIYYTFDKNGGCGEDRVTGAVNVLSRFTMNDDYTLDPSSETVLIVTPPLVNRLHNGGDMDFGNDGYLYVTIGDGGDRTAAVSANLGMLLGKVIRLTDVGGIPPDNPFLTDGRPTARCNVDGFPPAGSPSNTICAEIYAYGFRNPFRFAKDPNQDRFFVNDVGGAAWEETSELVAGGNFGWPTYEGPCVLNSLTNCGDQGPFFEDPIYYYPHREDGGAAVGGAFVPSGLWPDAYENTFLFADFVYGEMYVLREDPSVACRTCLPPIPGYVNETFHEWPRPVQLTFGPFRGTQALYYTSRRGTENLRRIYFVGGDNSGPIVVLTTTATEGPVGLTVTFDASASSDPDDDALTFLWDFGDGTPVLEGPATIQHTYAQAGTFQMTLRVRDFFGFAATERLTISVGTPPTATITSPPPGTTFAVGDVFTLSGSAMDGNGNPIPASRLFWEVRQHHNTHFHPFLDRSAGNNFPISPAPGPEDFEASGNSYLEVLLTAIDSDGVETTVTREIQPKKVILDFDIEPAGEGLILLLDDFRVSPPVEVLSWEKHQLLVDAPDQTPFLFRSWSNGQGQSHTIEVPPLDLTSTPRFVADFVTTFPTVSPRPSPAPTPSPLTPLPTGGATNPPTVGPTVATTPQPVAATPLPTPQPTDDLLQTDLPPTPATPPPTPTSGAKITTTLAWSALATFSVLSCML